MTSTTKAIILALSVCLAVLIVCSLSTEAQNLNVTSFGAVGDAVQFLVNCTSNSTTLTTSNAVLTSAAIGDFIEVMKAGPQTIGTNNLGVNATNNQDMVAVISNVSNGTNITISLAASNTLVNAFATYGFNNDAAFQSTIASATNSTAAVTIPTGAYLFIATNIDRRYVFSGNHSTNYYCVQIPEGGITFNGAGTNATRLIGQGAWQLKGTTYGGGASPIVATNAAVRGWLFEEIDPTNITKPLVFQNLTLDGGLQTALNISGWSSTSPANNSTGLGWDITHCAVVVNSTNNFPQDIISTVYSNVLFAHWSGEVAKELDNATNNNFLFTAFAFSDCNADCVNTVGSTSVSNGVFNGDYRPMEYQMQRMTNSGYFANCIVTNCLNFMSPSCSQPNPPWFTISGNTISISNLNGSVMAFAAIQNLIFSNNTVMDNGFDGFLQFQPLSAFLTQIPVSGVQSSNLFCVNNTISSFNADISFLGGSSITSTDSVTGLTFSFNKVLNTHTNYGPLIVADYGWHTNVLIQGNDFSAFNNPSNFSVSVAIQPNPSSGPYCLVTRDNLYYDVLVNTGTNENISYGQGSSFSSANSPASASYTLINSDSSNIPTNATALFFNANTNTVTLYLNTPSTGAITVPASTSVLAWMLNGTWYTNIAVWNVGTMNAGNVN